jgi:hypothetical protein
MNTQTPQQRPSLGEVFAPLPSDIEAIPAVEPVEAETELPVDDRSLLGLVELILKAPRRVDALARDDSRQAELLPRFLSIALGSYALFAVVLVLLLNLAPEAAWPRKALQAPPASWSDGSYLAPILAYTLGLVAASGLCLPSFYFFGLLAGVRLSWVQVIGIVARCKAASAMLLLGILPIYVAIVLGLIIFQRPPEVLQSWLFLGLVLPFLAGFHGVVCIYRVVMGLTDSLPDACRENRACFLRRLTVAWSACYTAVAPVMIYRLWESFAGWLA